MISLLQLKYFQKLAYSQHITNTAKDLFISQTALSNMIKNLELDLGVQLFDRANRSIKLNAAGKLYLSYVNNILSELDNAQKAIMDLKDEREGKISIAMGTSQVWMPVLHDFIKKYPNYVLKQSNMTIQPMLKGLLDLSLDFVIAGRTDFFDLPKEIKYEKIMVDKIYLCVSKRHKFANRKSILFSEIINEPFVNLTSGTPWQESCDKLLKEAGYNKKPIIECDYTMRAELVKANYGVALTTGSAKNIHLLGNNVYIPIRDKMADREMCLFWNSKKYMSQASKNFEKFFVSYWDKEKNK